MRKMKKLSDKEKMTKRLLEEYGWESIRNGILDVLECLGKDIPITTETEA